MDKFYLGVSRWIGTMSLIGMAFLLSSHSATAQTQPNAGSTEAYQDNEYDPNSDSSLGTLNPTELIHRANFSRSRNMQEFGQDSQENLNSAAEEYKRMQQERLQQSTPAN